jgi:hypothetical protein
VGLLKKIVSNNGEPKPLAPPKPVVLMPEEKAAYLEAVRRYKDALLGEGFLYFPEASYDPRVLMSSRWGEYDPRKVHVLDTPLVGSVSDIAVGVADSRFYATWVFHVPSVRHNTIYDSLVQVAGIFLGSNTPTSYSDSDSLGVWAHEGVRSTVESIPSANGVRIEHGWLLTDFLTIVPDVTIALAEWKYLDSVIEQMDTQSFDFGLGGDMVSLLKKVFPTIN